MTRSGWVALGTGVGVAGVFGLMLAASRRASAAEASSSSSSSPSAGGSTQGDGDGAAALEDVPPLPTARDVRGDLSRNWGDTPADLRPLFLLAEEQARIAGAGRILAVIAYRESRFVTTAHNGDAPSETTERAASRRAYDRGKDRNPPLRFGERAADFGSGGLFGLLAPYFLWTGVPEVGERAPLLGGPPELVFEPRVAAFAAAVYMQRILKHYRVDDHADLRAGWASPTLLTSARGGQTYGEVRARFVADAGKLGVDLEDRATIPGKKLDPKAWPGVLAVFEGLVGRGAGAVKEVA